MAVAQGKRGEKGGGRDRAVVRRQRRRVADVKAPQQPRHRIDQQRDGHDHEQRQPDQGHEAAQVGLRQPAPALEADGKQQVDRQQADDGGGQLELAAQKTRNRPQNEGQNDRLNQVGDE